MAQLKISTILLNHNPTNTPSLALEPPDIGVDLVIAINALYAGVLKVLDHLISAPSSLNTLHRE